MHKLSKIEAINVYQNALKDFYGPAAAGLVLLDESTIMLDDGWIFISQSKKWLETKSILHKAFISPVFVSHAGSYEALPTRITIEEWLAQRNA